MAEDHQALRDAFPYPPYHIQQQFMINVVDTLENRQIGLFESPTGAGVQTSVTHCHPLPANRAPVPDAGTDIPLTTVSVVQAPARRSVSSAAPFPGWRRSVRGSNKQLQRRSQHKVRVLTGVVHTAQHRL